MSGLTSVLIKSRVLLSLETHVQKEGFGVELGGLLLGLRKHNGLQIEFCTYPGPKDYSAYNRFARSDPKHRAVARELWKKSNKTVDWCGEWHSHPQNLPNPSSIDLSLWKTQVKIRKKHHCNIIFGREGIWIGIQNPSSPQSIKLQKMGTGNGFTLFDKKDDPMYAPPSRPAPQGSCFGY
jgi:integrative and conjugative element protein (TIGR02256 family)